VLGGLGLIGVAGVACSSGGRDEGGAGGAGDGEVEGGVLAGEVGGCGEGRRRLSCRRTRERCSS
jgi:hypothetical protein